MQAYNRLSKRYLSFPGPNLRLTGRSRQRLIVVNLLPFIMVAALAVFFGEAFYGQMNASQINFSMRAYVVSRSLVGFGVPLAMAALFLGGLRKWSRAEGSWMFAIGGGLAVVALGLGAIGALAYGTADPRRIIEHWHAETLLYAAQQLAFLSVPYFFVASRATSARTNRLTAPRKRIGRRPRRAEG